MNALISSPIQQRKIYLFLFSLQCDIPLGEWIDHILSILLPMYIWVSSNSVLISENAEIILVSVFWCACAIISEGFIHRSRFVGSQGVCIFPPRELDPLLLSPAEPECSCCLLPTSGMVRLLTFWPACWFNMVSHGDFCSLFPRLPVRLNIFLYVQSTIWISSFVKSLFTDFFF